MCTIEMPDRDVRILSMLHSCFLAFSIHACKLPCPGPCFRGHPEVGKAQCGPRLLQAGLAGEFAVCREPCKVSSAPS